MGAVWIEAGIPGRGAKSKYRWKIVVFFLAPTVALENETPRKLLARLLKSPCGQFLDMPKTHCFFSVFDHKNSSLQTLKKEDFFVFQKKTKKQNAESIGQQIYSHFFFGIVAKPYYMHSPNGMKHNLGPLEETKTRKE